MRRVVPTLALAAACAGCATTETQSVQRREFRRAEVTRRAPGSLRATITADGAAARILVRREQVCSTHFTIDGAEDVTTTRAVASTALTDWMGVFGIGGLLGGGGLMIGSLDATNSDGTPRDGQTWLVAGAAAAGAGALLLIPWIYRAAVSGSATATRPYSATEPTGRPPAVCDALPVRTEVALGPPGAPRVRRATTDDGRLDLDLASVLPAEALRGAGAWSSLVVTGPEGAPLGRLDLGAARRAVADGAWSVAQGARTPEGYARFAEEFPGDSRVTDARDQAAALRRARAAFALDAERARRWADAGDEVERLEAFVAEGVGDGWEVEVRCRTGRGASGIDALRAAEATCARGIATLDPQWRERHGDAAASIVRHREFVAERIAGLERAAREEEAAREAEVRAAEARAAEAEARAEASRERERRRAERAVRSAVARAREVVADCRGGSATGASAARTGYEALATARAGGASIGSLAVQIAAACRCTPACAGVAPP